MAADRVATLPAIPMVPESVSPELRAFLQPLKDFMELREGRRKGGDLERFVTFRSLAASQASLISEQLDGAGIIATLGEDPPAPPTSLTVQYLSLSHLLSWSWPEDSRFLDAVQVWCSATADRSFAQLVASISWPVASWERKGISPLVDHYYWIRIVRAGVYSEWDPPDGQGGQLLEKESYPTITELVDKLLGGVVDGEYKAMADRFLFVLSSAAIPAWEAGAYAKYAKVKHTLPGPGLTYYESLEDNNTDPPPSEKWQAFDSAVLDKPTTILGLGTVDGAPTMVLRADLVADGTILGRHISASSQISLADGGHLGIGADATILVGGSGGGTTAPGLFYDGAGGLFLRGSMVFSSASGYGNISDAPYDLATLDPAQDNKLDLVAGWQHPADTSKMNGANIYADSAIQIGNLDGQSDYAYLYSGDLKFYYWNSALSIHQQYKSVRRIEVGVATSGVRQSIPGIFKQQPLVMVSPFSIPSYDASYPAQDQSLKVIAQNIALNATTGLWEFDPVAQLVLANGTTGGSGGGGNASGDFNASLSFYGATLTPAANCSSVSVNYSVGGLRPYCESHDSGDSCAETWNMFYKSNITVYLQAQVNGGAWTNVATASHNGVEGSAVTGTLNYSANYITAIRLYVVSTINWTGYGYGTANCNIGTPPYCNATGSGGSVSGSVTSWTGGLSGNTYLQAGSLNYLAIGD